MLYGIRCFGCIRLVSCHKRACTPQWKHRSDWTLYENPGSGNSGSTTDTGLGDGIDAAEEAAWVGFLQGNDIESYSIGLGTGVSSTHLNPIAYDGIDDTNSNAILVTDLNTLGQSLTVTVPEPLTGDLLTGNAIVSGFGIGADGGYIDQIVIAGTTYTFDGTNLGRFDIVNGRLQFQADEVGLLEIPNNWSAGDTFNISIGEELYSWVLDTTPVNSVGNVFISFDDLIICQADGMYTKVYTRNNGEILISKPLKYILDLLDGNSQFCLSWKIYLTLKYHNLTAIICSWVMGCEFLLRWNIFYSVELTRGWVWS